MKYESRKITQRLVLLTGYRADLENTYGFKRQRLVRLIPDGVLQVGLDPDWLTIANRRRNWRSIASIDARHVTLRYDVRLPVTLCNRPVRETQLIHTLQAHSVAVRQEHGADGSEGVALYVPSEIQLAISALTAP